MKKILLIFLIVVGSFFQLVTVFKSGSNCQWGICFWGPNGHDGVWHLSLINQVGKGLPLPNPVFAGEVLKNYHWGYDFFVGLLAKIIPLPITTICFRLIPLIFAISLGVLSFKLGVLLTKDFWVGFWFAFLNYFAGSLGWLVTLIRSGVFGGESVFWSMQSISFLLNPPYAMSVLFLFLGFYLFKKWENNLSFSKLIILGIIFGSLLNVKAYAAILFFLSWSAVVFWQWLKEKKVDKKFLSLGLISLLVAGLIWLLWQRGGGFPFIFEPLWFVRTLFEASDRLFIPKLGQIWWILRNDWLTSPKFWLLAFLGTLMFLIGNFATRLFGFLILKKKTEKVEKLFLGIIFFGVLIPLLFLQKGTAWNTIQFLYYALIFANWFLAKFISLKGKQRFLPTLLLVLPLLPTNIGSLKDYFGYPPPASVPGHEVEALDFLKAQPEGIVLTFPYDSHKKIGLKTPIPLYLYETTAYVSAFSNKVTFLEDEMNLTITGFDWQKRRKEVEKFFSSEDKIWSRGFLVNNVIDYLYLVDDQKIHFQESDLGIKMIFDNSQVKIYQVSR